MYQFTDKLSREEFEDFSNNSEYTSFFQSSAWSDVKDNWEPAYVGMTKENQLVAASLILKRKLAPGFIMLYAPRGPLVNFDNEIEVETFFKFLQDYAKKQKAFIFTVDPHVFRASAPMIEVLKHGVDVYDDSVVESIKKHTDFKHLGFTENMYDTIQPRYQAVVYFDEWWLENHKKTRGFRDAQRSEKLNVKVRSLEIGEIDIFESVMQKTEEYKEINLRDGDYYRKLKDAYKNDCHIVVAYLDVSQELQEIEERIKDFDNRLANPQLGDAKRKEYEAQQNTFKDDQKELETIKRSNGDIIYLAGGLTLKSSQGAELLYAGMDRDFAKYQGSDLVYVNSIEWAHQHGCSFISFGGVHGGLDNGLTKYKLKFSPRMDEFIGEFSYVNKPFRHKIFEFMNHIRDRYINRQD